MMNNNKILTVSYGTFSCTLEGFDDSFGTMKAIAEYFRDLAADDRYFGAEPPQPDAEMLSRIAEREISRRVEVRQHEGRIVLSANAAGAQTAPAAVAADAPVPAEAEAPVAAADTPMANTETAEIEEVSAADAGPDVAEPVDAQTAASGQPDQAADEAADSAAPENAHDDDTHDPDAEVAAADIDDLAALDGVASDTAPEADAFFAESDQSTFPDIPADTEMVSATPVTDRFTPAPDSIAAKLQRIRAVVSKSQEEAEDDYMFEDEHAENFAPAAQIADVADPVSDKDATATAADIREDAARDIDAMQQAGDQAITDDEDEDDSGDDVAAILARFDAEAAAEDAAEQAAAESAAEADTAKVKDDATGMDGAASKDAHTDDAHTDDTQNDLENDLGRDTLAALMASDTEADSATGENLFGDAEAVTATDTGALDATAKDDSIDTDGDQATSEPPRRARILKVKRADIDAAIASGALEEVIDDDDASLRDTDKAPLRDAEQASLRDDYNASLRDDDMSDADDEAFLSDDDNASLRDDDDDDTSLSDVAGATTLSDAQEAELLADLADVEAELAEPKAPQDAAAVATANTATTGPTTGPKTGRSTATDDDVSRLMAEADHQMDEPEGTSRRSAFAHLRAAVMAKKADTGIGSDDTEDDGAYRSDLASVVKPRRPAARGGADARPDGTRPAPLKLVAEQRVDIDAAPKGPVRPRRVATLDSAPARDADTSFAEYAAEMGAHDLPALLEAAASYLSFVEGRDQFSRPQLMTKVRQVEKEDFSREDGLRSFGKLLRAGKIEKIKGGRFAVTGDIGYRPDQRAAS
jgi:hypothetical protein